MVTKEQTVAAGNLMLVERADQSPERWGEQWFETGPLPMMAFDRNSLAILAVNEAAVRLYGYSREEFLAMTIEDIRPREEIPHLHEALRAGDSGGPFVGRHRNRVGTVFDVRVYSQPIMLGRRTAVLAQIQEAGERVGTRLTIGGLEAAPDAMAVVSPEGKIVLANAKVETMFGYSKNELLGQEIEILVPERLRTSHLASRQRFSAAPRVRPMGMNLDLRALRKDGTEFPVEISLSPLETETGIYVTASIRDASERKRRDEEINAANEAALQLSRQDLAREHSRGQMLLEINNALITKRETRDLFAAVSATLRQITRHIYSQICLYDAGTQRLVVRAVDFPSGGKGWVHEGLIVAPEAAAGAVYASGQPLLISRLDRSRFPADITDRMLNEGVKSVCLSPLRGRDRTLGVLSIGRSEEGAFSDDDLKILTAVANQVSIAVENAMAFEQIAALNRQLAMENLYLDEEVRAGLYSENLIGESKSLKQVLKKVETAAPTDATILLMGETGTGKELIARTIHDLSRRSREAFIKLNCSAIPTGLLESEFFGHEKGAFTGALTQKLGRLEIADHGTLFLDEVGDLPLELQPKLLRVLQDGEFERLGGNKTIHTNVRFVAATNRDLDQMMADLKFREDLYYRLNVFPITLPPLRDRVEDIPLLSTYFVQKYAREMKREIRTIPQRAMRELMSWPWPGNIRELQNFLQRAVILSPGPALEISLADLKQRSGGGKFTATTLRETEREHILQILRETKGIIGTPYGASAKLGLKRTTLYAKMRKLGIKREDFMT